MRTTPAADRKQMWCKLAVLIANGLPAPRNIDFYEPRDPDDEWPLWWIEITVVDASALWRWSEHIGAEIEQPQLPGTADRWHQKAQTRDWLGWQVDVKTYNASQLGEADGMAAVRAVAASIPGEGEEVGGSGSGQSEAEPPAAPTESAAGSDSPADGALAGRANGGPAALPSPSEAGTGAAVTPDVWVPIRRRGVSYHALGVDGPHGEDYTVCGRAARRNGSRLPLTEALDFGTVPCPRCYSGAS